MQAAIARVSMLQTIIRSADDPTAVQKEPYHAPRIWSCCYPGARDADLFSPRPASSQRRVRPDGFRAAGWQSALQLAAATLAPAFGASGRAVRLPADVTVEAVLATRCNNRPAGTTIRHLPSG